MEVQGAVVGHPSSYSLGDCHRLTISRDRHINCLGAVITIASLAMSTFSQQMITLRTVQIPSPNPQLQNETATVPWADIPNVSLTTPWAPEGDITAPTKLAIIDGISHQIPAY